MEHKGNIPSVSSTFSIAISVGFLPAQRTDCDFDCNRFQAGTCHKICPDCWQEQPQRPPEPSVRKTDRNARGRSGKSRYRNHRREGGLRARAKITWHFAAAPRRNSIIILEVCHAREPQPFGARRRAGSRGVAAPRRCHHIACVAAPCICPSGARAKMPTNSCANPKASGLTHTKGLQALF